MHTFFLIKPCDYYSNIRYIYLYKHHYTKKKDYVICPWFISKHARLKNKFLYRTHTNALIYILYLYADLIAYYSPIYIHLRIERN